MKKKPAGLEFKRESLNITNDQALASVKRAVQVFREMGIRAVCYDLDASPTQGGVQQASL
jgi:hypothetical protein